MSLIVEPVEDWLTLISGGNLDTARVSAQVMMFGSGAEMGAGAGKQGCAAIEWYAEINGGTVDDVLLEVFHWRSGKAASATDARIAEILAVKNDNAWVGGGLIRWDEIGSGMKFGLSRTGSEAGIVPTTFDVRRVRWMERVG